MISNQQLEILQHFKSFLSEANLSAVSVKNYLSDIRRFFEWLGSQGHEGRLNDITAGSVDAYLRHLANQNTPQSTVNRFSASYRRFVTFLKIEYRYEITPERTASLLTSINNAPLDSEKSIDHRPTPEKLNKEFKTYLQNEGKSPATIKNYISDINHFWYWTANLQKSSLTVSLYKTFYDPELGPVFHHLLTENTLNIYTNYLKDTQTSSSVINRRTSTFKKFCRFAVSKKFISEDPFRSKIDILAGKIRLAPLSWIERYSHPTINKLENKPRKLNLYERYNALPITPYLHLALLVLFTTVLGIFAYTQVFRQALPSAAFPTSLTRPTRQLSFQARLTDSSDTPIATSTAVSFKLWNLPSGGTEGTCSSLGGENCLYKTGTCTVNPDQDGIFNVIIGDGTCGGEIPSNVFSENISLYLEVLVGASTLTPRQQIATVGFALNSETLQGYPASQSATANTVPVIDSSGNLTIAAPSPSIISTSGTFAIKGQAISLQTATGTNGNIVLAPDGSGQIQALGGTTTQDFLRITNANLTSGSLISGYIGNNTATGNLLRLSSGSVETDRFVVGAFGQTTIEAAAKGMAALIVDQLDGGPIFAASVSGVNKFFFDNGGSLKFSNSTAIIAMGNGNITDTSLTGPGMYFGTTLSSATDVALGLNGSSGNGSNTGVFFPDRDITAFSQSGTEIMRIGNGTGNGNVGIGSTNPGAKLDVAGNINTSTVYQIGGSTVVSLGGGTQGIMLGVGAGTSSTGTVNTFVGFNSGNVNSSGQLDTFVGGYAGASNTNGGGNAFFGYTAGYKNTGGGGDTFIGAYSGYNNLTGNSNTYIGSQAGLNSTGSNNVFLGFQAGYNETGDNKLYIANSSTSTPLIYGDFSSSRVGLGTTSPAYTFDVQSGTGIVGQFSGRVIGGNAVNSNEFVTLSQLSGGAGVWLRNLGLIYPSNSSDDVIIGQSSTPSSTVADYFQIFGVGNGGAGTSGGDATSSGSLTLGTNRSTAIVQTERMIPLTLGSATTGPIQLSPKGTTGLYVDSNGNVGIGTTIPGALLDAYGPANSVIRVKSSDSAGLISMGDGGGIATRFYPTITAWPIGSSSVPSTMLTYVGGADDSGTTPAYIINSRLNGAKLVNRPLLGVQNYDSAMLFIVAANGNVGINAVSPVAKLDVRASSGTTPVASVSGATVNASVVVDNSGLGDLFTASTSGQTRFVIDRNGFVGIGTSQPAYLLDVQGGSGIVGQFSGRVIGAPAVNSNEFATLSQVTGTAVWSRNLGLIYPTNISDDVIIGQSSTPSSTVANYFQIFGTGNGGSGTSGGDASTSGILTLGTNRSTAIIQTQSMIPLTLGSATTGPIQLSPKGTTGLYVSGTGNVGIGTTSIGTNTRLEVKGTGTGTVAIGQYNADSSYGAISLNGSLATNGSYNFVSGVSDTNLYINRPSGKAIYFSENDNSARQLTIASGGNIGIGTISPLATLDVRGNSGTTPVASISGSTSMAALVVNNTSGIGDLFTASTSGQTRFVIDRNGFVGIGTSQPAYLLDVQGGSGIVGQFSGRVIGGNAVNSNEFVTYGQLSASTFWQESLGALAPFNITDDVIIGRSSTPSSSVANYFQIFGTGNGGTGTTGGDATSSGSLTLGTNRSVAVIQTERMIPLTLGSATTGPIQLSPKGTTGLYVDSTGFVGINTTAPSSLFTVYSAGDLFTVTPIQSTFNNPTQFTSAGDVSIAYDLNFTNPVSSFIRSAAPLTIASGETFNNNDLTLQTYGVGGTIVATTNTTTTTSSTSTALFVTPNLTSATNSLAHTLYGINSTPTVNESGTGVAVSNLYNIYTGFTKTAGTISNYYGNYVAAPTGSGTITNSYAFVSESAAGKVGLGTTAPTEQLDVAGNATISGNLTFYGGARTIASRLGTTLTIGDAGTGNIVLAPKNGAVASFVAPSTDNQVDLGTASFRWRNIYAANVLVANADGTQGFWQRTSGSLAPYFISDSINIGAVSTSSAFVHLGGTPSENSFINNGNVAIGTTTPVARLDVRGNAFNTPAASISGRSDVMPQLFIKNDSTVGDIFTASSGALVRDPLSGRYTYTKLSLDNAGDLLPGTDNTQNLGSTNQEWSFLYLKSAINKGNKTIVNIDTQFLGTDGSNNTWNIAADASISGSLYVAKTACIGFDPASTCTGVGGSLLVVGSDGTGKIDVGTIDPPYTINGEKYATYIPSMVGVREEVTGNIATTEYVENLGYRQVIDFNNQPKASDLWLFSKVTSLKDKMNDLAVLLTPQGSAKAWYEVDPEHYRLTIYTSRPTTVSYRLSATRFDGDQWSNTRSEGIAGFNLNDPDKPQTLDFKGDVAGVTDLEIQQNGQYRLSINNQLIQDLGSFAKVIVANIQAGLINVSDLVVSKKLISPVAEIDDLTVNNKLVSPVVESNFISTASISAQTITGIDATISGTLYAAKIDSPTVKSIEDQIADLTQGYATAGGILATIKAQYQNFSALSQNLQSGTNASVSADVALDANYNLLTTNQLITDNLMVNTTLMTNSINSIDSTLYLQPAGGQAVNLLAGLMILTPDGKVVVNGDLYVSGKIMANNSHITGSLQLGATDATESGNLLALYGNNGETVSAINSSGAAEFKDVASNNVVTQNLIIAAPQLATSSANATSSATVNSNASIGVATITAGQTELTLANTQVDNHTLVYLTPISDTQNQVLFVKSKNEGVGFTVAINQPINNDLQFNYWLIKTQ